MYGTDKAPVAYFLNPSSVKVLGDRVAYTGRYPLHANVSGASSQSTGQGVYEDDTAILDCKKSVFLTTERTIYNNAGERIFHSKSGEPKSADLSNSAAIPTGSLLSVGQYLLCDEQLRTLLLSKAQLNTVHLSYLANAPDGDGNVLYGPIKQTSNPAYPIEVLFVDKKNGDHELAYLFPGQNVRGLPSDYRIAIQNTQINCAERKIFSPVFRYYDADDNLIYLNLQFPPQPLDVVKGSIIDAVVGIACGASALNVTGNYEGMNYISYRNRAQAEQKVSITIQQNGSDLKVSFQTPNGGSGEGIGKLTGNRIEWISLHSTAPSCPGSYNGSMSFADNSLTWFYKGEDCGGAMEGHGTAPKVQSAL